jgi:hypothetical protein
MREQDFRHVPSNVYVRASIGRRSIARFDTRSTHQCCDLMEA